MPPVRSANVATPATPAVPTAPTPATVLSALVVLPGVLFLYLRPIFLPPNAFTLRLTRNTHTAEDIAQRAFLNIYKKPPPGTGRASFKSLIFTVARNEALNEIKRRGRRQAAPLDKVREEADGGAAPEAQAHGQAQAGRVQAALATVPPDEREIVLLREVEGLTFREALELVVEQHGISMPQRRDPEAADAEATKREAIFRAHEITQKHFAETLLSPQGEEARTYLKNRGLDREAVDQFGIGYAPRGNGLVDLAGTKHVAVPCSVHFLQQPA